MRIGDIKRAEKNEEGFRNAYIQDIDRSLQGIVIRLTALQAKLNIEQVSSGEFLTMVPLNFKKCYWIRVPFSIQENIFKKN